MDGAHLMSSYSICSFILVAWRLASGLIYCTLLRLASKDRIIHFLLDCSAVLTLSERIRNFNESLQYPRKSKVHWPPFTGRDLQHLHLSLVLTFIWNAFSSPFSRETFFYKVFSSSNLLNVVAENVKNAVKSEVAIPDGKFWCFWQSNKLSLQNSTVSRWEKSDRCHFSYRSCDFKIRLKTSLSPSLDFTTALSTSSNWGAGQCLHGFFFII